MLALRTAAAVIADDEAGAPQLREARLELGALGRVGGEEPLEFVIARVFERAQALGE